MQRLTRKATQRLDQGLRRTTGQSRPPAIDGIPQKRMADIGHMHPDLMGAPGFEFATNQGGVVAECFNSLNPCNRVTPAL